MSDLRIVLLGKSVSENSLVGNFILGRAAFDSEAPPDVVERVGGRLKDRHLIIINSPQLLQTYISDHQITQTVRECVFLSDPGPHVIVLLLRPEQCSAEDQEHVEKVLLSFSERIYQHTIVISTQESTETSDILQRIIQKCANRHFRLKRSSSLDDLLQAFEDLVKINDGHHLDCGSQNLTVEQQTTERQAVKLNLVVCGTDGTLKSSISERILQQTNRRSDMELHSHLINLISLPALNQLSEEEVMRQSLYCVSLCHPGVHVFIIIIPVGPLTDEDKAETEKIQRIFDSREHFILLFTTSLSVEGFAIDLVKPSTEAQILISLCGGQYKVMGLNEPENSRQIPELLEYIEKMKTEPYSLQMYMKAQKKRVRRKTEEKYKEELKRMENKIKELKQKIQSKGAKGEADDQECLRIVLIGRTGNGKSATGNTILGRNEFESKASTDSVTTDCQKELGEVDGRSVAVVDTPGLFDTTLTNYQVTEEIVKCVSLLSPGPHVFVIVLSVTRFTKEETDTLDLIKKIFGPKAAQFSIVLFTRGDDLEGESIEDYLKRSKSAELKKLIRDCGNRFLAFNNREKQDKTQVIQLLNMIEELKNSNQGRYFTNSMFEEAEMSIKKRMEEILKEKEREIQTQIESLKARYELDMKNMSKRLEEEKQRADEEKIKMENQLKKIEEKVFFEEKKETEQEKREIENQKRSEEKQQRAEYYQKTEEMKREIEKPRSQYEKQQKEKEDRKREKKYRQDQEKMNKRTKDEHEQECNIAEKKLRNKEEKERKRWKKNKKRKIKETENDRKEVQEEIKGQQREWEDEKKRQMREREEGEKKGNEKQEQLRKKQKELEKIKKFEREREERQKIEDERQKKRIEREEKEREYKEKKTKMERHERLEQERKDEWEKRKREDNERREEERKRWEKMIEDLKQEREEMKRRERERRKREEKERDEMKQKYEEEIKVMKKKYEDEAKKQAEEFNDFRERKKRHKEQLREKQEELEEMRKKFENDREVYVQEITGMLKDIEEVEKEKDEDIKELHQEVLRRIARNKNSWFFQ